MLSTSFERPYFVTPHAVRRYVERVHPGCSAGAAIREVQAALQQPAFQVNYRRLQATACS